MQNKTKYDSTGHMLGRCEHKEVEPLYIARHDRVVIQDTHAQHAAPLQESLSHNVNKSCQPYQNAAYLRTAGDNR